VDAIIEGRNFSRKDFPFQLRITTATVGKEINEIILINTNIKILDFSYHNYEKYILDLITIVCNA